MVSPKCSELGKTMTSATASDTATDAPIADDISRLTLAWALKRTLLGVAILIIFIGGMAWLMHAAIDPTADARTIPGATAATAAVQQ